jgi:hypothetical protein
MVRQASYLTHGTIPGTVGMDHGRPSTNHTLGGGTLAGVDSNTRVGDTGLNSGPD